jgi:hypothetical protein
MREYHLYLLGPTQSITKRIDLQCEDDAAALAQSLEQLAPGQDFELWQSVRRLHPPRAVPMERQSLFPRPAV